MATAAVVGALRVNLGADTAMFEQGSNAGAGSPAGLRRIRLHLAVRRNT